MWKCSVCERENSDTAVCCQCGYDKSKDYRHYFVLSPLSEKVRKSWSSNQPGNKYLKDWNEWSESLKKEFQLFDNVEAKWFLNEMKNRCDGLLDQAKNIKKEAQRLNDEGYRWYRKMEYEKAISNYRKAAELDNMDAINNLGVCYLNGQGVLKNEKMAVEYFGRSAKGGDAIGQYNLGYCYQMGKGVKQDAAAALQWYIKAAKNGYVLAQRKVGDYYFGQGYINDADTWEYDYMKEAVYWYQKAAEGGDVESQRNLGYCYRNGKGVKMHKEKAAGWYEKAALQGDVISQKIMAELYDKGEGVRKDENKSRMWLRIAAGFLK